MTKIKRFYELEPATVALIDRLANETRLNKNALMTEAIEVYTVVAEDAELFARVKSARRQASRVKQDSTPE